MDTRMCPMCSKPGISITEIGWKKLRVVGESPRGYRYAVLTKRVPTAVIACDSCDWEEHGYIDEGSLHLENTREEVSI